MSEGKHTPEPRPLSKARIVACVKACEGINPAAVKEMVEALEAFLNPEIDTLQTVRMAQDALRKAREEAGE